MEKTKKDKPSNREIYERLRRAKPYTYREFTSNDDDKPVSVLSIGLFLQDSPVRLSSIAITDCSSQVHLNHYWHSGESLKDIRYRLKTFKEGFSEALEYFESECARLEINLE